MLSAVALPRSLDGVRILLVEDDEDIRDLMRIVLEDAAPRLRALFQENPRNCVVSFISGPSRTGDIEMILTLGVHGPETAHAIIVEHWDVGT